TQTELQSLIDSGSEWNELNGVNGRYFGDGAEKLFLPAAGYRLHNYGEVGYTGEYGFYWSSTVYAIHARYLGFVSGTVVVDYTPRAHGFTIRCVAEL
ncbi:MAG: fibrobacter succinogenes major paralogous domain-containing protein, partial [Bacteroidales bacterium]|nr:fibrobacter succinogenes major paralogous domain-containing protein [Bacteroidales bacterium]